MAFESMRTFYLFHNEEPVLKNILPILKNQGLEIEYIMSGASLEAKKPLTAGAARITTADNLLLLSLIDNSQDISAIIKRLHGLEASGLLEQGYLGQVKLAVYSGPDWTQIKAEANEIWQRQVILDLQNSAFSLARLGWLWPDHQAVYIIKADNPDGHLLSFMDFGLAQIEAAALKLHTISDLYISQSKYISEEKTRLDRALSELLRQQPSLESNNNNLPDVLEANLNQLSDTYVILSGYYRVMREAYTRTAALLSSLRRLASRDAALLDQRAINTLFFDYYVNRLTSLREVQKDLQSSLNDYQAAIQMLQGRIDVMNSRENLNLQQRLSSVMELNTSLQEQSLTFQIAASLIEFIILAYYSLSLYKYLAPDAYHHLPSWALFIMFTAFAGEAVMATHVIAEKIMGRTHKKGLGGILIAGALIITLAIMFYLAARF